MRRGGAFPARGAAGACALLVACAGSTPPAPGPIPDTAYTGELVPTDQIPGNFLMRQHLRFRAGDEAGSLDAVVQKRCDELVVVGLTPFGTRAFTIRQRGTQVEAEIHLPGSWPFPPRNVLVDVHRVYFVPFDEAPPGDGWRQYPWGPEIVTERWESGRLVEREFRRADGRPPGRIAVRYSGGVTPDDSATEVRLENGWYDYTLDITTVSRTELTCPRGTGVESQHAPGAGANPGRPPSSALPDFAAGEAWRGWRCAFEPSSRSARWQYWSPSTPTRGTPSTCSPSRAR